MPDGRETIVIGDAPQTSERCHVQGENLRQFTGTCGICSCEAVLQRFGVEVTEDQLVEHAVAHGTCFISADLSECGGTTVADQVRILSDFGVPATYDLLDSIEELAQYLELGRSVIICADSGVLWNQTGDGDGADHAVVATHVARDPWTHDIQGIVINDSATGVAGRLVEVADLESAWLATGGICVVTELTPADLARKDSRNA